MEVLALTDGDVTLVLSMAVYLYNKRRSHVIEKVVLLTWKKCYNYQKNWGVWVMSTTQGQVAATVMTMLSMT
jgi:hypothetical protein